MLTYQNIKDYLENVTVLFGQLALLQETLARVHEHTAAIARSSDRLLAEQHEISLELARTEKIGEVIRKCVYDASNQVDTNDSNLKTSHGKNG